MSLPEQPTKPIVSKSAQNVSSALILENQPIRFHLNGEVVSAEASAQRLSEFLRNHRQSMDVKNGCNAGDCGACTVLVNEQAVCSCLMALSQLDKMHVQTLKGLAESDALMRRLQNSFLAHGAAQCGICTPGMLVSAYCLLRNDAQPDEQAVRDALGGVLCRCTGYRKIIRAVMQTNSSEDHVLIPADARKTVGEPLMRLDGLAKVCGTDQFGDDVRPEGSRELRIIRSPYHSAKFQFGDLQALINKYPLAIDGILTARDIPGKNEFGVIPPYIDQPVFAEAITRYKGEAVAAVVGDGSALDAIVDQFPIQWEELPAVLDPVAAMQSQAAQLHEAAEGNILCQGLVQHAEPETAIRDAPFKVSGSFSTGFIEHAYIEPEAGYARRQGDSVEVYGCTQAPYMNRSSLAHILGIDTSCVRILPSAVGGGFGSKLDLSFQPYVALAAWHFKKPVRMAFSRSESMQSTTKRHPARMHAQIAADAQGRIQGMLFEGIFNTGAYASWGPTVANRVPVHASGPYYTPHYRAKTTGVYTNCAPAGAFRGFGVPQAAIAQESLFDELADALNMDRLAFRILNALDNNQRTVTGQRFTQGVGIKPCLQALEDPWQTALGDAGDFNKAAIASGSVMRRGVGVASGWYGCGNTSLPNPSTIKAGIRSDGTVCLHQGAVDIGQGSNTVIAQIFAQTLGLPIDQIELIGADTSITPDAGKTSASRQTFVSGNAACDAARLLLGQIARQTNCSDVITLDVGIGSLLVNAERSDSTRLMLNKLPVDDQGYVFVAEASYDPPTQALDADGQGDPYALFGYAAQMAILDVDIRLGSVTLQRVVAAHDVGRAINPVLVEGQVQGGIAQGIGLALMEEFIPGRTENLHDYLIPTIGDVPPIDTIIVEEHDPHGPMGAKGLGEHVLIPTAPAILNAITHACGARIRDVPATPDKVLAELNHLEYGG
ncbi:MAG: molybdopterin-dependent oxidoreductase [Granulosicoccus sp.]|nr:molybdopterin-dependent oxidoreductase [Granulosicoccus sp.]